MATTLYQEVKEEKNMSITAQKLLNNIQNIVVYDKIKHE